MNKQRKNGIGWTDRTWSPLTGCLQNCWYCYGRAIKKRFGKDFKPTFWPDRLEQPLKLKKPSKIFVCSISDMFGDWVSHYTIIKILEVVKKCPQHTFQFLTRNPIRYQKFKFPENCWLGETITHFKTPSLEGYGVSPYSFHQDRTRFVSFEPLMTRMELSVNYPHDWIIIGAMTGDHSHHHQPQREWVESIVWQASQLKVPVFMKQNLKSIWKGELIREFPTRDCL